MAFDSFRPLDEKSLLDYLKATPSLAAKLGNQFDTVEIKEVGDGNLNFVFVVKAPLGSLVIKQALPYIRCIGESWPMTKDRAYFEALALEEHGRLCPNHVPQVYHFDREMSLIGMRYIEPPHINLRKGLISAVRYPFLAEHVSDYMSKTLFYTSLLYLTTTEHKAAGYNFFDDNTFFNLYSRENSYPCACFLISVAKYCGNVAMVRHTAQVIFSDPYKLSEHNRWNSPYLDADAEAVREDNILKLEVAEMKSKFCERSQALIHGDLHTSSLMVTVNSTQVIDPEFAFYGPMGFDVGAFIGNLILAYYAQDGLADEPDGRKVYKEWLLKTISNTWNLFHRKFTTLWDEHKDGPGEAYLPEIFNNSEIHLIVKQKYMEDLFHDSLGFGAAKMIRRIVGVAHAEDLESIEDVRTRAICERKAVNFAKKLMKERTKFHSIDEVVSTIQHLDNK